MQPPREPETADRPTRARPADAVRGHWTRRAPDWLQPYLELSRLDRPIGAWLLYWPCVGGVLLAAAAVERPVSLPGIAGLVLLFGLGAVVMRGAGCSYNDIVDRKLDAQVARTRGRPLPSGRLTVRQAAGWTALQLLAGLAVVLAVPPLAAGVAIASLLLVALYPFMKRITWWPQAWLGLTFNWGALVGWAAVAGNLALPAVLLYIAGLFWTLGYDTIYALQDAEDDALAGIKSSARRAGGQLMGYLALFYTLSVVLAAAALWLACGPGWALPVAAFGCHLAWQLMRLRHRGHDAALALFRSNREAGALLALALLAPVLLSH